MYRRYRDKVKPYRPHVVQKWKKLAAESVVPFDITDDDYKQFLKNEDPMNKIVSDISWCRSLTTLVFEYQHDLCSDCALGAKHVYLHYMAELID